MASSHASSASSAPTTHTLHDILLQVRGKIDTTAATEQATPLSSSSSSLVNSASQESSSSATRTKKRFAELSAGFILTQRKRCRQEIELDITIPPKKPLVDGSENKMVQDSDEKTIKSIAYSKAQVAIRACEEEDQAAQQAFEKTRARIQNLRRTYLYGIGKVAALQDLRHAPDAILPGNFISHEGDDVDKNDSPEPTKKNK